MTLFELCLELIAKSKVDLDSVKKIINSCEKFDSSIDPNLVKYLKQLKTSFDDLCETYVEIVIDRDGKHCMVDIFAEKKIFLLIAQPDDFPVITIKESANETQHDPELGGEKFQYDSISSKSLDEAIDEQKEKEDATSLDSRINDPYVGSSRPFSLYDFGVEYSTDSGPESEAEIDENSSRPPSRLGFSEKKKIICDSGRTSREDGASTARSFESPEPIRASSISIDRSNVDDTRPHSRETIDDDAEVREAFSASQTIIKTRRKSEHLLLSQRNSLKFLIAKDDCYSDDPEADKVLRSRSLMDLQRSCDFSIEQRSSRLGTNLPHGEIVSNDDRSFRTISDLSESSDDRSRLRSRFLSSSEVCRSKRNHFSNFNRFSQYVESPPTFSLSSENEASNLSTMERPRSRFLTDLSSSDRVVENFDPSRSPSNLSTTVQSEINQEAEFPQNDAKNMEELLKDYERTKRGFRINPFLQNVGEKRGNDEHRALNQRFDSQSRNAVGKDSEAHRKAWAETLSTALEWALALPVIIIPDYKIFHPMFLLFFCASLSFDWFE